MDWSYSSPSGTELPTTGQLSASISLEDPSAGSPSLGPPPPGGSAQRDRLRRKKPSVAWGNRRFNPLSRGVHGPQARQRPVVPPAMPPYPHPLASYVGLGEDAATVPSGTNIEPTTTRHGAEQQQPVSGGRQSSWLPGLMRRLEAGPSVHPYLEVMHPVLAVLPGMPQISDSCALNALFTQRLGPSLVTASLIRFLGLIPMDLPPGSDRSRLPTPWGFIPRKYFARLVIKQPLINLEPTILDLIVVDDRFFKQGFHLHLGRWDLQRMFGGNLPPRVSVAASSLRAATQKTAADARERGTDEAADWMSSSDLLGLPTAPQPLMSEGFSAQPTWDQNQDNQAQTPYLFAKNVGGQMSYPTTGPFTVPHLPTVPEEDAYSQQLHRQQIPLWGEDGVNASPSMPWPPGAADDLDFLNVVQFSDDQNSWNNN